MYGTIEGFKDYAKFEGYDVSAYADAQIEAKLTRATVMLDNQYLSRWIGSHISGNAEQWPRTGAIGTNTGIDYPSTSVPQVIQNAAYELCYQSLIGNIGQIKQDVGVVVEESKSLVSGMSKSVKYAEKKYTTTIESQVYSYIDVMISDFLKKPIGSGLFNICRTYQ